MKTKKRIRLPWAKRKPSLLEMACFDCVEDNTQKVNWLERACFDIGKENKKPLSPPPIIITK